MLGITRYFGKRLARYLAAPNTSAPVGTPSDPTLLAASLQPGDVLLVEGASRISTAIKYLTQSTWSHASLYIGPELGGTDENGEPYLFVEADIVLGVCKRTLAYYLPYHTRICRPSRLRTDDLRKLKASVLAKIGHQYDMRNVFDLARYLLPQPPVPARWRRKMISLGSGDPTKAICSSLIAEAFQGIGYPILPLITLDGGGTDRQQDARMREIFHIRHHSLYMPRDFDVSPYFEVVKPTLVHGFDYRVIEWSDSSFGASGEEIEALALHASVGAGETR